MSVHQFDHHSVDFAEHWRQLYAHARDNCPVLTSDAHGGFTALTRYDDVTPGTGVARTVLSDTTVGEVEISAGRQVFLALGSANTDPDVFDDADALDIRRTANRHLAFGAGLHRCLGSFLAAREMTILLEEVLRRLPDLWIDESGVRAYRNIPLVAGFEAMPATFTPGPRADHNDDEGAWDGE